MLRWLKNVLFLAGKEFRSLFSDPILIILIVYMFSVALVSVATSITTEVKNASIAIVDHDRSALSYRLQSSLIAPNFKTVREIEAHEVDRLMDTGTYTFVLDIPPGYEKDILAGRNPKIQLLVDATAMTQAAIGSSYISQIFNSEINTFLHTATNNRLLSLETTINVLYNPNHSSVQFMGTMQIVGNLNLLTLLLVGAAVVVILALRYISHGILDAPLTEGSLPLFTLGAATYIFAISSLGIMLAIFAPTMPQFGLLCIPVYVVMYLLSGTMSPLENMPILAQQITQFSPTTLFGAFTQDVVFRGAGFDIVWDKLLKMMGIGAIFLVIALFQFRSMLSKQG